MQLLLLVITSNNNENGLLRVKQKITMYKLINKPSVNLQLVFDKNRVVISFENIENSIHIIKDELESINLSYWEDSFGFQENVLTLKQSCKYKNPNFHLFFYDNEKLIKELLECFSDCVNIKFIKTDSDFFINEINSVAKTARIFSSYKHSVSVSEEKLDIFIHQVRRLINYCVAEDDYPNLKRVLEYLCEVKNGMNDTDLFMKRLFEITTPYMSEASLEYLNSIEEAKFLFANKESDSWTSSAENVEFNIMLFKYNMWNDSIKKKLIKALASTDVSDLLLFDEIKGIEGNSVKQEWALIAYSKFLDIENERRQLASEPELDIFPISPETLECFVLYLGQYYAVNTIRTLITLIHESQIDHCSKCFSEDHWNKFRTSVMKVKIHRDLDCGEHGRRLEGIGKCPSFYPVLFLILDQVPKTEKQRDFYNSLFLFMIYTGQRYVTICNIKLSDIITFRKSSRDGKMIVTIIARVTKANNALNQPYSIEGSIQPNKDSEEIMNFIYWLNETLKKYHNLDLKNIDNWPKEKLESKYLWGNSHSNFEKPISYTTVYVKNRRYYEKAGIPSKLLALASFRSGFYCQAYLNSVNHRISTEVLNELTMLIAGWRDLKTQTIYKKKQLDPLLTLKGKAIRPTPAQMLGCEKEFISQW